MTYKYPDADAFQEARRLAVLANELMASRAKAGMPISLIQATQMVADGRRASSEGASFLAASDIAAQARLLMHHREEIGLPVSLEEAVTLVSEKRAIDFKSVDASSVVASAVSEHTATPDLDRLAEEAIAAGVILEDNRDWAISFSRQNPGRFIEFCASVEDTNKKVRDLLGPDAAPSHYTPENYAAEIAAAARDYIDLEAKAGRHVTLIQAVEAVSKARAKR
ncbi:hypothetical protein ASD04_17850 [Devosia sp. Root436]|uniref:hypothetical protein n=1 Tax=Devosia sp. Root436 TaxID=1736537 RepID=UPI00070115C5|nr:hypothetical protein [Devosia sp. Root436]KQX34105.1 hypothetical protein ASD04_17850 [Devosia sp. Root436]